MKHIIFISIIVLLISCKKSEQIQTIEQEPIQVEAINNIEKDTLKNFTYEDVARFTMSSVMGQTANTIKVLKKDDLYFVSYIRKSDKKKFEYKIKFDASDIVWANTDGRWRNSQYDEKISFKEEANQLNIIQTFSDGSQDIQSFKKGE